MKTTELLTALPSEIREYFMTPASTSFSLATRASGDYDAAIIRLCEITDEHEVAIAEIVRLLKECSDQHEKLTKIVDRVTTFAPSVE